MAVLPKIRAALRQRTPNSAPSPSITEDKEGAAISTNEKDGGIDSQSEFPDEDLQRGVQAVEAVTLNWSKASLIAVFLK
jgi:hypothetical protein